MPLQIQSIQLRNFRQYRELHLEDLGRLTVLVGPNAAGKTSIIEAIQLLTALSTLRRCPAHEMIRFGTESAQIKVQAGDGSRQLEMALMLSEKSRKYTLNGKAKRIADLRGTLPAVTFSPDDLELAKGPHGIRRRALDQLGVQLNANYLQLVHDFEKIHRHKNKLLKDEAPQALLDAVNETFAQVSSQLTNYRRRMFERLIPHMRRLYAQLVAKSPSSEGGGKAAAAEELSGEYSASWEHGSGGETLGSGGELSGGGETPGGGELSGGGETPGGGEAAGGSGELPTSNNETPTSNNESPTSNGELPTVQPPGLPEAIRLRTQEERARARALEGAHLDRISFTIGGADAQRFASQGQQRSLVLAWKLAEVELVREILHQPPILLLDDVMSELDSARRAGLMDYLSHDLQTFITTANAEYFTDDMLSEAQVIKLPIR